ncbi:MAG: polysaccharide pyruvyl transferase family protein [Sedimentisphaerales bacterium]|nr:polysaccharide pyruvyl transferase family protein [Sedimentisphaerales bacterium]
MAQERVRIGFLGASLGGGNLGVRALAESAMKCVVSRWPDAEVTLLGTGSTEGSYNVELLGRTYSVETMAIRICPNVFLACHIFVLLLLAWIFRMIPSRRLKEYLLSRNACARKLVSMDLVVDISGGDSFSDIYGIGRFLKRFLLKLLVVQFGKKLVLLPQTYGPFKHAVPRLIGKYVLKHADIIYARDKESRDYVCRLLGREDVSERVRLMPDVAFVLDPKKPGTIEVDFQKERRQRNLFVVGLNISGLLFNGGYSKGNMFGLAIDYRRLIDRVIDDVLKRDNTVVVLIPHVYGKKGSVENDYEVCRQVYAGISEKYAGRIFLNGRQYDHKETKNLIGDCDLLIGSRMHACIAAMSQTVPAVGLAYSRKFRGVFESAGVETLVIDMRTNDEDKIMEEITRAIDKRNVYHEHLAKVVPGIQKMVLNTFEDYNP